MPLLLSLLLHAAPALADRDEAGAQICERAILEGARREGVPEGVLHAISLTETGRAQNGRLRPWPWAINREGKGYWFANRDEALAFAKASVAGGRTSFDVGCFQINYYWHGRNFRSLESMFDPANGADYAARFLRSLYAERGDWSAAAGAYHSQSPDRAGVYRARFDRILAGLGGAPLTVAAAEPEPAAGGHAAALEQDAADPGTEDHNHPAQGCRRRRAGRSRARGHSGDRDPRRGEAADDGGADVLISSAEIMI